MPKAEGNRLTLFVCFDSVRVAAEVPNKIGLIDSTADMVYVTQPEFAAAQKEQESAGSITIGKPSAFFDGQVMFLAHYDGPVTASKPDTLADQVRKVASDNGNVMAFGEMTSSGGVARFRVEYTSIKAAKEVVKKLTADEPANVNVSFSSSTPFHSRCFRLTSPPGLDGVHRGDRRPCERCSIRQRHRQRWARHAFRRFESRRLADVRQSHRSHRLVGRQDHG